MIPKPEQQFKTNSTISCCRNCVAPKRHKACWDDCPEYQKERAEYETRKAEYYGDPIVNAGLTSMRTEGVTKALRDRRKK